MSWSSDGERLVFVTAEREIGVADARSGTSRVLTNTRPSPALTVVEARRRDGSLVSSFSAPLLVSGLAYSGGRVALVVEDSPSRPEPRPGARAKIEIRTSAGRLLRRVRVARPIWGDISMSGRWVVFTTWPTSSADRGLRAVRLLDTVTGKTTVLARAKLPIGSSIDGRRVAWGEQDVQRSRIRAVVLPRG